MRVSVVGAAALIALASAAGCSATTGSPRPVSSTVAPTPSGDQARLERSERIRRGLLDLGCTTNSCIQTYFACMDGYLTGDPCDFYRRNPLD